MRNKIKNHKYKTCKTQFNSGKYTSDEVKYLTDIFTNNPNPDKAKVTQISNELNRHYDQVYHWFARKRKPRKPVFDLNSRMNKTPESQNNLERPTTTSPAKKKQIR